MRLLSKHYSPGPRVKSVLKVLAKMRKRDAGVTKSTPYLVLWQAAAEFLLERSGTPPEPPRNWIIDARLGCSCKACRQLGSFCADPYRKSTKIGVARPLRKHLRSKIDALNLDIDYETERSGSPFKLVCTKNRASYQRRLDRYRDDVVQMKALIAAVPDMDESRRESENLERLRNLTRPSH